jgi:hypothetical protein
VVFVVSLVEHSVAHVPQLSKGTGRAGWIRNKSEPAGVARRPLHGRLVKDEIARKSNGRIVHLRTIGHWAGPLNREGASRSDGWGILGAQQRVGNIKEIEKLQVVDRQRGVSRSHLHGNRVSGYWNSPE